MAQAAYERVEARRQESEFDALASLAREFPSLVHACGLAQAVLFARAKGRDQYLEDLAVVLKAAGHPEANSAGNLALASRELPVPAYMRLSRSALQAAGWIKRYFEALK